MNFYGNLMTTGMGILPHKNIDKALDLAFRMDVPFWPQLPRVHYHEDMYVQFSENFPGMKIDLNEKRISLDKDKFYEEFPAFYERIDDPELYAISPEFSQVFHSFLSRDLSKYPAIRGQVIGPISFGIRITDQDNKSIIYDPEIRDTLFEFISRKVNHQYRLLVEKNPKAFIFLDEPGLEFIFSSISGYTDVMAGNDMNTALTAIDGQKGIHLCGNPDWDFLLNLNTDILSFSAFHKGDIFIKYVNGIRNFLNSGGIISWGVVPANFDELNNETAQKIIDNLEFLWDGLDRNGITREVLVPQGMLMPATCSLINPDGYATVEKAYDILIEVSDQLKSRYKSLTAKIKT
ncbi:MAG: hypothetical protein AAB116_24985 [Candidatus Poribacteria bacterium]